MNRLDRILEGLKGYSPLEAFSSVEITRSRLLAALGYFLWGAVVFAVVFSAQYFVRNADSLVRKAVADLPGVTVEFSHLDPQLLPPSVTLDYLHVRYRQNGLPLVLFGNTSARLSLLPLLIGKVEVSFKSLAYGGLAEGSVATGALFDTDQVSGDLKLDLVEMDKVPQAHNYDKSIKGFVSMEASFEGDWADPLSMRSDVMARLEKLDMENRFPVVKGSRLKGDRVNLDCTLHEGILTIRDFDFTSGDGIVLKSDGIVSVDKTNIYRSKLNMKGRFSAPVARLATTVLDRNAVNMLRNKQALTITIGGTLERPQIQVK